jgi:hypothetical protein
MPTSAYWLIPEPTPTRTGTRHGEWRKRAPRIQRGALLFWGAAVCNTLRDIAIAIAVTVTS